MFFQVQVEQTHSAQRFSIFGWSVGGDLNNPRSLVTLMCLDTLLRVKIQNPKTRNPIPYTGNSIPNTRNLSPKPWAQFPEPKNPETLTPKEAPPLFHLILSGSGLNCGCRRYFTIGTSPVTVWGTFTWKNPLPKLLHNSALTTARCRGENSRRNKVDRVNGTSRRNKVNGKKSKKEESVERSERKEVTKKINEKNQWKSQRWSSDVNASYRISMSVDGC